jgi:hypothetical protein
MGFLDRLKEGAGQAKELAGQAVDRAKEEAKELQLKREIGQAQGDLGRTVFDLAEKGELSHAALGGHVERIRALQAELGELEAGKSESENPSS